MWVMCWLCRLVVFLVLIMWWCGLSVMIKMWSVLFDVFVE